MKKKEFEEILHEQITHQLKKQKRKSSKSKPVKKEEIRIPFPSRRVTIKEVVNAFKTLKLRPMTRQYYFSENNPLIQTRSRLDRNTTALGAICLLEAINNPDNQKAQFVHKEKWLDQQIATLLNTNFMYIHGYQHGFDNNYPGNALFHPEFHLGFEHGNKLYNLLKQKNCLTINEKPLNLTPEKQKELRRVCGPFK